MRRVSTVCAVLALVACGSPEATRTQGGGPGADKGNRSEVVRMHEGSRVYENTPHLAPTQPSPAESANHPNARGRS